MNSFKLNYIQREIIYLLNLSKKKNSNLYKFNIDETIRDEVFV